MRGWVRAEGEIELIGAIAEMVQHTARLHPRIFFLRIDFKDLVQVLGEINDHSHVAALPGQAGSASARQQWSAVLACHGHNLNYLFDRLRNDNADGDLTVVRPIDGVEGARSVIKADFAADGGAQLGGESVGLDAGKIFLGGCAGVHERVPRRLLKNLVAFQGPKPTTKKIQRHGSSHGWKSDIRDFVLQSKFRPSAFAPTSQFGSYYPGLEWHQEL